MPTSPNVPASASETRSSRRSVGAAGTRALPRSVFAQAPPIAVTGSFDLRQVAGARPLGEVLPGE